MPPTSFASLKTNMGCERTSAKKRQREDGVDDSSLRNEPSVKKPTAIPGRLLLGNFAAKKAKNMQLVLPPVQEEPAEGFGDLDLSVPM